MNDHYRNLIANEFRNCVTGTIARIQKNKQTYRPFHTALLSEEVIFGADLNVLSVHPLASG